MQLRALMQRPGWLRLDRTGASAALIRRQTELIGHAAAQRVEVAALHARIQASSVWLETGLGLVRSVRAHPQAVLLSLMAASMTFGKGMSQARSWTLRGLAVHQLYRVMGSGVLQLFRGRPEQDPAAH
jgi:hypothetical protein